MRAEPFVCYRPQPERAQDFASLPYDVFTREEAREAVARRPHSFLAIDRPETAFDPSHDMHAPDVYEKAANLLYFVVKNHSFLDGNKRIAAAIFLYFLDRNNLLYDAHGEKRLQDDVLVAMTIMIAESNAEEKEAMVRLVMNFLCVPKQSSSEYCDPSLA